MTLLRLCGPCNSSAILAKLKNFDDIDNDDELVECVSDADGVNDADAET